MKPYLLYYVLFLVSATGCNKPETGDRPESRDYLGTKLSSAEKLQLASQWQLFRGESDKMLLQTNEKLEKLESILLKNPSKKGLRRKVAKYRYQQDELFDKLLRRSLKFTAQINHFTYKDRIRNESFKTSFTSKIRQLDADLDACLMEAKK